MTLLVLGILLFAVVHFIPSLAPSVKVMWRERWGEGGYKGGVSVLLLASFALIIGGWRSTEPVHLYQPPQTLHTLALALMAVAFILLTASTLNSRLRRVVRHPQLTGIALWGGSHLLLNGDNRSLVLFGGMALWAIIEIIAISRREGSWHKEAAPAWAAELRLLLAAAVIIAVLVSIHPWLSGMPVLT